MQKGPHVNNYSNVLQFGAGNNHWVSQSGAYGFNSNIVNQVGFGNSATATQVSGSLVFP